jgi:hypothetical protein
MTATTRSTSSFPPLTNAVSSVALQDEPAPARWSLDAVDRLALGTFVGAGVVVAVASAIPAVLRSGALLVALTAWTVSLVALGVAAGRALRANLASPGDRALLVVGIVGTGVAVASALQLQAQRWIEHRPALTWYIDWRFALGHARAIARFGGVDHALDYAGAPIDYHVGPAWFAGAVERVFGGGAEPVLFGLVPVLCTLSLIHACTAFLGAHGVRRRAGLAATALAITLPVAQQAFFNAAWSMPEGLLDPRVWSYIVPSQMPNSMLALPLGVAAIAIALRPGVGVGGMALAALGLAAVVQVKPQYFVGLGLALGAIGILRAVGRQSAPRSASVLITAAAALALALLALVTLPGDIAVLGMPRQGTAAAHTYFEVIRISTFVAVAGVAALVAIRRFAPLARPQVARLPALLAVMGVLLIALEAVFRRYDFLMQPRYVAQSERLGLIKSLTPYALENDLVFSMLPLRLFLMLGAFAAIAVLVSTLAPRLRLVATVAGMGVTATPLVLMAAGATGRGEWFVAAEDADLRAVLLRVPRGHELLIASDLADPAQNYRRPLRGTLLTAYAGHQFLVSNLRYVHFARADAVPRLEAVRAFYGAPWSPWHRAWLARTGVTHVLVHARCPAAWDGGAPPAGLRRIAEVGAWRAFEVTGLERSDGPLPAPPAWTDVTPRFGLSDCLYGTARQPPP